MWSGLLLELHRRLVHVIRLASIWLSLMPSLCAPPIEKRWDLGTIKTTSGYDSRPLRPQRSLHKLQLHLERGCLKNYIASSPGGKGVNDRGYPAPPSHKELMGHRVLHNTNKHMSHPCFQKCMKLLGVGLDGKM